MRLMVTGFRGLASPSERRTRSENDGEGMGASGTCAPCVRFDDYRDHYSTELPDSDVTCVTERSVRRRLHSVLRASISCGFCLRMRALGVAQIGARGESVPHLSEAQVSILMPYRVLLWQFLYDSSKTQYFHYFSIPTYYFYRVLVKYW